MIRVGFSTHKRNPLSWLIRTFTKSKCSHTWLLVDDTLFGITMVLESTEVGFRIIPFDVFKTSNEVVAIVEPRYNLDTGVRAMARYIGMKYDFIGLFGTIFVMIGRWFKKKVHNPCHSAKAMFCSEAVVGVLIGSGYPGAEMMDPTDTSPQDILDFFKQELT